MGILCNFSQYRENHDILGAVYLHKYITSQKKMPGKSSLKRHKSYGLDKYIQPEFIGNSLTLLRNVMGFYVRCSNVSGCYN